MKYKVIYIWFLLVTFLFAFASCSSDEDNTLANWKWDKVETNSDIVSLGWTNVGSTYGSLPSYINVYKAPTTLQSKSVVAYIAVADMSKAAFSVLGDVAYNATANGFGSATVNTPAQFYSSNKAYIIINGGLFFYDNSAVTSGFYYTQSLLLRDSKLLAPNQNYYSTDWTTFWYPTIGAFCQMADGTFKTTWTYYTNDGTNYSYDAPAENNASTTPLAVPSATFPSAGTVLVAQNAIGGVTVLLHGGKVVNTYVEEMLDVSAASDQPRTAIGYTSGGKLIFFVCEGRGMTKGIAGLTTADEAEIMKALGCTEALNLDGGGSSCMLVNGKETIKPSDGSERAVLTGCSLK